jgi:deoxyribodipyrimidine photo-lyase
LGVHPHNPTSPLTFTRDSVDHLMKKQAWRELSLSSLTPGEDAALAQLDHFINEGLDHYDRRNEVDSKGQSYLSAYLHFGMLSPLTMIRKVKATGHPNAPLFIEEALVRRELAENFVHYCEDYDSLKGAWSWAQKTLDQHRNDPREYLYTREHFEAAQTHDALWNACQRMVIQDGYLHSYLRMYWAKMVLLWSASPEEAIATLIALNDTYFLDGRDPNGYTGILWSVAGVHDRPWFDKPVHGLIRAMGKDGTLKKTKVQL